MCISEIAVMTGNDGRTVPLNEPGSVVVYRRDRGIWRRERTFPLRLGDTQGLAGLRRRLADLAAFLGPCRIFIAATVSGAASFELAKARCQVWEIPGTPEEFLDTVWREAGSGQEATAPVPAGACIPAPRETSPGNYSISIKDIQRKRPEVSSKQVLQQFIRLGGFAELVITCDHLPPWIEAEAEQLGISVETRHHAPPEVTVILKRAHEEAGC
jgi:Fe-only nitrogenase accessory protein AnfO